MVTSFFQDILGNIADRGRSIIELRRERTPQGHAPLLDLSDALVSNRGEASGTALASEIVLRYRDLGRDERVAFLVDLTERFGADPAAVESAIAAYRDEPSEVHLRTLHQAAEPRRQELLRRLNMAPLGTPTLVAMRQDCLAGMATAPNLAHLDQDFRHLFGSWFNRGFLVLRRIDWQTPAAILEKIIRYEAVHEIAGWEDLRRRIDPPDRRLYAFFHPALDDDPLIFVEVALTAGVPGAIAPLLAEGRTPLDPEKCDTAVFYSISNCQKGLAGISFGHFLIKQVAEELAREFPAVGTFVTLSPAPKFRDWLRTEGVALVLDAERDALSALDADGWPDAEGSGLEALLMPLAAHYFLRAKNERGRPPDPVARFHLGNGARLERLNWLGDRSAKGLAQAAGLMVNYRYVLKDVEKNHEAYAKAREVVAASAVHRLLRNDVKQKALVPADG